MLWGLEGWHPTLNDSKQNTITCSTGKNATNDLTFPLVLVINLLLTMWQYKEGMFSIIYMSCHVTDSRHFVKYYIIEIGSHHGNCQLPLVYSNKNKIITHFHNKTININPEVYNFFDLHSRIMLLCNYFINYLWKIFFFPKSKSKMCDYLFAIVKLNVHLYLCKPRGIAHCKMEVKISTHFDQINCFWRDTCTPIFFKLTNM